MNELNVYSVHDVLGLQENADAWHQVIGLQYVPKKTDKI